MLNQPLKVNEHLKNYVAVMSTLSHRPYLNLAALYFYSKGSDHFLENFGLNTNYFRYGNKQMGYFYYKDFISDFLLQISDILGKGNQIDTFNLYNEIEKKSIALKKTLNLLDPLKIREIQGGFVARTTIWIRVNKRPNFGS